MTPRPPRWIGGALMATGFFGLLAMFRPAAALAALAAALLGGSFLFIAMAAAASLSARAVQPTEGGENGPHSAGPGGPISSDRAGDCPPTTTPTAVAVAPCPARQSGSAGGSR